MAQAFAIVRKNPRIDMMIWFLLRDDRRDRQGWQSGFFTAGGKTKAGFADVPSPAGSSANSAAVS